ncbi:MAG: alpha/beta hydrolase [Actinomycetota bacterium]|nr:alpha/beta hydrolase [Actinomycetota bacterium]
MSPQDRSTWRSPALGEARILDLPGGRIGVHEAGSGPPIVFVHGLLVNANLWRKVVERLAPAPGEERSRNVTGGAQLERRSGEHRTERSPASTAPEGFRCIALDLPLGSHVVPAGAGADLTPPGLAGLIAQALDALELEDVTLVGNDTGGALCQMLVTTRPERVGRLVLTSCDYRDNFPPAAFRPLKVMARIPGATQVVLSTMRPRAPRRLPVAFGWLTKRPIDRDAEDSYVYPAITARAVRADLRRTLPAIDPRHTRDAAARLHTFDRPALIAWAREDKFFPTEHAEELAAILPDSRLEWIDDSYTFSPEDQPARLSELIAGFVRGPAALMSQSKPTPT